MPKAFQSNKKKTIYIIVIRRKVNLTTTTSKKQGEKNVQQDLDPVDARAATKVDIVLVSTCGVSGKLSMDP